MKLKDELKELNLERLKNEDYLTTLIDRMLENIGSTDPELRDTLIYSTFHKLISGGYLQPHQMEYILKTCLDRQHLFFNIGEKETDSVFTRSFSSLVIALVLDQDARNRFLPEPYIKESLDNTISYLEKEVDTRGYVEEKGWAHSIAHGADLLTVTINHPLFEEEYIKPCLLVIKKCLLKGTVYVDDEDERLLFAVEALIEKGIEEFHFIKWIDDVVDSLDAFFKEEGYSVRYYRQRTNTMNFFKSLYFRLQIKDCFIETRKKILEIVHKSFRERIF